MNPISKKIIVLSTLINGRENYVAGAASRHGMYPNKWNVNHTTDLHLYAKEFTSIAEAEAYIPMMHNPHQRVYAVVEKEIQFKTKKEFQAYERIL